MKRCLWLGLLAFLAACGSTAATPTADPAPMQTRAAEATQLATPAAPTATAVATAPPTRPPATATPPPTLTPAATATPRRSPRPAATATPSPPPATPLQIGQVLTLPGWPLTDDGQVKATVQQFQATVTDVQERRSVSWPSGRTVVAQGKFVLVFLTIRNLGQEEDTLCGSFHLRDGQGRLFHKGVAAAPVAFSSQETASPKDTDCRYFQPGLEYEVVTSFDVAADSAQFVIVLRTPPPR